MKYSDEALLRTDKEALNAMKLQMTVDGYHRWVIRRLGELVESAERFGDGSDDTKFMIDYRKRAIEFYRAKLVCTNKDL